MFRINIMFSVYYKPIDDTLELCFYIEHEKPLNMQVLNYVLGGLVTVSSLHGEIFEVGPKLTFKSSWCSNALQILNNCGLIITRIEMTKRTLESVPFDDMLYEIYLEPLTGFVSNHKPEKVYKVPKKDIKKFCVDHQFGWDDQDVEYYSGLFSKRDPTNVELVDIAQSNSEHSRHHFFNAKQIIDGKVMPETLFQLIKKTLIPGNSELAFCDNASAITGYEIIDWFPKSNDRSSVYIPEKRIYHPTLTAETHNFPTGIASFPGASTGVGGRVRDTIAIGRGGRMIAGTAGYCVADKQLLIRASNGASDYGNKLGEPIIQGFTRFFDSMINGERWAWIKPIMFSGGIGMVKEHNLLKNKVTNGLYIVRAGGPAYRIGVGGSCASSQHQTQDSDLNAVQRGDPEMGNKLCNFIRVLAEGRFNPILSIHDQGAGGTANVTKEIVFPVGGTVYINNITNGDNSLSSLEKWIAEYQEQVTFLIKECDFYRVFKVATRENIDISIFGETTNDGFIKVQDDDQEILSLDLETIFDTPQKEYRDIFIPKPDLRPVIPNVSFKQAVKKVLHLESVGSKRFLTNKVDRSVSGLIVQQQCVGPLQTPISDYALVAHSYFGMTGTATSIGEQPLKAFYSSASGKLAVIEMLTNLMWVKVSSLQDIKCSVNWMWPAKLKGENAEIYNCMKGLSDFMIDLGISADGGKDSLSMYTQKDKIIKSPRSVVVSSYVTVPNIEKRVTPDLKDCESVLLHISLAKGESLAGSAFSQAYNFETSELHIPTAEKVVALFEIIQILIEHRWIIAGHDISDGGLVTTLIEMAIAGNVGVNVKTTGNNPLEYYFSETPGVIIQVPILFARKVQDILTNAELSFCEIATSSTKFMITHNNDIMLDCDIGTVRGWWEKISVEYETQQCSKQLADAELDVLTSGITPEWTVNVTIDLPFTEKYCVAVVRDEGSNGQREMAAAFIDAGFKVFDVTIKDLAVESRILDKVQGVAFVGGFTYADVFGAGVGWAAQINCNPKLMTVFEKFKNRPDTFSIGVCNGCQLMSKIGWIPECSFENNYSNKFESRISTVQISKTNSIMLKDMETISFGIWVAHSQGRFVGDVSEENIAMRYVDQNLNPTECYPYNPNGSPGGVTGLCSTDGRHLAMMPHPERCWKNWQMPWLPDKYNNIYTPWFKLFTNAYQWCKDL